MAKQHQELIAKEGWVFLFPFVILAIPALVLGFTVIGVFFAVIAVYIAYFFRNPYRQIPTDEKLIVSPADGKVVGVRKLDDGRWMVSIFLNIFNVHVNRCPIGGTIEKVSYTNGKFLPADRVDASHLNERNMLVIKDGDFVMEVVQVAGLVARRIVCWSKESDVVGRGERFGLIRFGSRVDMFLPGECRILVEPGQKIVGGSGVIGERPA